MHTTTLSLRHVPVTVALLAGTAALRSGAAHGYIGDSDDGTWKLLH